MEHCPDCLDLSLEMADFEDWEFAHYKPEELWQPEAVYWANVFRRLLWWMAFDAPDPEPDLLPDCVH